MHIVVNGEKREVASGPLNVEALLQSFGAPAQRVAVELNGLVVVKAERRTTPVNDGDVIEIVTLVGGG